MARVDGDDLRLPLSVHPLSNGEYDPLPRSTTSLGPGGTFTL
jgi:hypothetical protein